MEEGEESKPKSMSKTTVAWLRFGDGRWAGVAIAAWGRRGVSNLTLTPTHTLDLVFDKAPNPPSADPVTGF